MKNYVLLFIILTTNIYSQTIDELKISALRDAKATSEASMNKDIKTILNHTHPNISKKYGKKELTNTMKEIFKTMEDQNISITSTEIHGISELKKENKEYRCLITNTTKMDFNGKGMTIKSSVFGFYEEQNQKWVFVEANKLINDPTTKLLFPDFITDISIPLDEQSYDN